MFKNASWTCVFAFFLLGSLLVSFTEANSCFIGGQPNGNGKNYHYMNRTEDDITGGAKNVFPTYPEMKGKVALVTGGSSGIGEATVWAFVQQHARVVFCGRDPVRGQQVQDRMRKVAAALGDHNSVYFFKADVTKDSQVKALVDFVLQKFGTLDYAFNNAGVPGLMGKISTHPDGPIMKDPNSPPGEAWEEDPIANNAYGVYHAMKYEVKALVKLQKDGAIVNTASYNGIRGCPTCALYAASKHAIVGLTRSVALEYARKNVSSPFPDNRIKVRVNAIAPGLIDTRFTRNQVKIPGGPTGGYPQGHCAIDTLPPEVGRDDPTWKADKPAWAQALVSGELGEPYHMANTVLFLCSDAAAYISGTVISADGADSAV